jgi:Zn ribbon nucleic-acid-binding protein
MVVDLDDVSGCPVAPGCESCDTDTDLAVVTADTPVGVLCCTICPACIEQGTLPVWGLPGAALRVLAHCGHLGIDVDMMAGARDAERDPDGARPLPPSGW